MIGELYFPNQRRSCSSIVGGGVVVVGSMVGKFPRIINGYRPIMCRTRNHMSIDRIPFDGDDDW